MSYSQQIRLSRSSTPPDFSHHMDAESEALAVAEREEVAPPSQYQVVMMNDDFTPMDFVVEVLEKFFSKSTEQAAQLMMTVHTQGAAVCGVYSKDIALSKAWQVNEFSRENDHPLLCKVQKAD